MINITDKQQETAIPPIWRQAFRPFFLFGVMFSAVAMSLWLSWLNGWILFSPYGGALFWHAHEMLFGFVGAIVVGFLLTAVQNWTGLRATHGWPLFLLFVSWGTSRILLLLNLENFPWVTLLIDLSFFVFSAVFMANLVIRAGNYRNLFFVPILLVLTFCNLLTHLSVIWQQPDLFKQGMYAAIMTISTMLIVIGGRVIPMFTANGTGTQKCIPLPWLERVCVVSAVLLVLFYLTDVISSDTGSLLAGLFAVASVANAVRLWRWRPWVTFATPLVWSLHFAYAFIPVSFLLLALHYAGYSVSFSSGLHGLTAGAMGSMIIAMIARVSLGHSGRPLKIHVSIKYGFMLIIAAGLIRITAGLFPQHFMLMLNSAGIFWLLASLLYIVVYLKILITPRADGHPG